MDSITLFGQTADELAADPWSWRTFRVAILLGLERYWPRLTVLLLGMAAAVASRPRHPAVSRRVLLGCAGLLLVELYWVSRRWLWLYSFPRPPGPAASVCWDVRGWALYALATLARLACLWLLVSAVLSGRMRRSEGDEG